MHAYKGLGLKFKFIYRFTYQVYQCADMYLLTVVITHF